VARACSSWRSLDHHCDQHLRASGIVCPRPPGLVSRLTCTDGFGRTTVNPRPTTGGRVGTRSTGWVSQAAHPATTSKWACPVSSTAGKRGLSPSGGRNGVQAPSAIPSRSAGTAQGPVDSLPVRLRPRWRISTVPKPFPKEFRRDVIPVARQGDQSIAQVVRSFGVSESCLARWLKIAAREDGLSGEPHRPSPPAVAATWRPRRPTWSPTPRMTASSTTPCTLTKRWPGVALRRPSGPGRPADPQLPRDQRSAGGLTRDTDQSPRNVPPGWGEPGARGRPGSR
jgi:transposase-like protein